MNTSGAWKLRAEGQQPKVERSEIRRRWTISQKQMERGSSCGGHSKTDTADFRRLIQNLEFKI